MATDYQKKEPSKTEKVLMELMLQHHDINHRTSTNSALVVAACILLGVSPEKLAEQMVTGQDKIKEFSQKVNAELDRLSEAHQKKDGHAGHDHGHQDGDSAA